jgi:hypothetical protein
MAMDTSTCKTCRYVFSETDKHGEIKYQCRRFPPTIVTSSSPAIFPKILPNWNCGEYKEI